MRFNYVTRYAFYVMRYKTRQKLFILFVLIFFIITPLIILHAVGYRITLSWPIKFNQILQKTGMFIINTKPKGAIIYLNNKPQQLFFKKYFSKTESYLKTPDKIQNLLPGEYDVQLKLRGHWSWKKKLNIYPGQTTYIEEVYLLKKELPVQIFYTAIQKIAVSPNKKYSAILNNNQQITILDLDNELQILTWPQAQDKVYPVKFASQVFNRAKFFCWSPDSQKILVNNNIIDLKNTKQSLDLNKLIGQNIENIKWNENNYNQLYYQYKNSINLFDFSNNKSAILMNGEKYLDYLIKDDYLFLITQIDEHDNDDINKTIKFQTFSLKEKKIIQEIDLPYSPQYELLNERHKLLNLYDNKHKILYLIDPLANFSSLKKIINNIKYIQWVDDKKLLYANDFEVWLLDMDCDGEINRTSNKNLLTRISEQITNIFWHPNNNYVFYSTDKTINVIELNTVGNKRNIIELIKFDKIDSIFLNANGDILYFNAKIGNQEGLYKLAI